MDIYVHLDLNRMYEDVCIHAYKLIHICTRGTYTQMYDRSISRRSTRTSACIACIIYIHYIIYIVHNTYIYTCIIRREMCEERSF